MVAVTISKKEYDRLLDRALRYEYLRQILNEDIFAAPSTKNTKAVLKEFRLAKRYNQKFLESLEKGLKRSSYFT